MRKGRASRRRLQKLKEISKAEQELYHREEAAVATTTPPPKSNKNLFLPSDRSNQRAPVVETRQKLGWKQQDEAILVRQLGFVPGNAIRISCRVHHLLEQCDMLKNLPQQRAVSAFANPDDPAVAQLYPLAVRDEFMGGKTGGRRAKSRKRKRTVAEIVREEAGMQQKDSNLRDASVVLEPFPTIYWLTHPLLKVWVSKLEVNNLGTQLEARLKHNTQASERMKRAHLAYGKTRLALLTKQDREEIEKLKWAAALEEARGVAGIRNHMAVKCLHAHLAHHLSGDAGSQDNVIGEWVMEEIRRMLTAEVETSEGNEGEGTDNGCQNRSSGFASNDSF